MTDHNTHNIGDLIKAYLKSRGLEERMDQVDLNQNWEKIAGTVIAKHTKSLSLKNGILTLQLNSAPLRHTLTFSKSEFLDKLNDNLGREMITDIVLK